MDPVKMDEYCKDNNFAGWYETSAKENVNIDEAAKALVNKVGFSLVCKNRNNKNMILDPFER